MNIPLVGSARKSKEAEIEERQKFSMEMRKKLREEFEIPNKCAIIPILDIQQSAQQEIKRAVLIIEKVDTEIVNEWIRQKNLNYASEDQKNA